MKTFTAVIVFLVFCFSSVTAQLPQLENDTAIVDTSQIIYIYSWKLQDDFEHKNQQVVDTSFLGLQVLNPAFKNHSINTYLGNLGLPVKNNFFFERENKQSFLPLSFLSPYIKTPDNNRYYNTYTPYTRVAYTAGGPRNSQEQTLSFLHTQNIKPHFNVGVDYDLYSSVGQYKRQTTKHNTFSLFSSFEGDLYTFYFDANVNNLSFQNNGGIVADSSLQDGTEAGTIDVWLSNASTEFKNQNIFFAQTLNPIGLFRSDTLESTSRILGTIKHVFNFNRGVRMYMDENPDSTFYPDFYVNTGYTFDSLYFRKVSNLVRLELKTPDTTRFNFNGYGGLRHSFTKYVLPAPNVILFLPEGDTIVAGAPNSESIFDLSLVGGVYNRIGDGFEWMANAEYFFTGFNTGGLKADGYLQNKVKIGSLALGTLRLYSSFSRMQPDFLVGRYFSNHYQWDNYFGNRAFKKEIITKVGGYYETASKNIKLSADYAVLGNKVYFNRIAQPAQETDAVGVLSAGLKFNQKFFVFGTRNNIVYQNSTNRSVIRIPELSVYHSLYWEYFIVPDVLFFQLGYDLYFHTRFYADNFSPATGFFYRQNENEIGNYPLIDVFLNFELKRTRFFLKFAHVNSGYAGSNYFYALHYPYPQRIFKFGLTWSFYD